MGIKKRYVWLVPFSIITIKWILIFYIYKDFNLNLKILFNFDDLSYFPFIISLSDLNLSPTFNEYYNVNNLISFPQASIIIHAIFYKIFGLFSYVILQIIFVITAYILIYHFAKKTGVSELSAILGVIIFFSFPIFFQFLSFFDTYYFFSHFKEQIFDYYLVNFRFPRPLVTNLFFYSFLIFSLRFLKDKNSMRSNHVFLGILLSMLLQSFIHLFLLASFLLILLYLIKIKKKNNFLKKNIINLIFFLFSFIFFSFFFFYQLFFSEPDYSLRMGLVYLDFEKRKKIFIEVFFHLVNFKYLLIIFFYYLFYLFLKKNNPKLIMSYKFYLLIFFISILMPLIFIIFSPYVIWLKHFFDVKNLVFLFGLFIIFTYLIDTIIKNVKFKNIILIFILLLTANSIYYHNTISKKYLLNKVYYDNLKEVINKSETFTNKTKQNIFSNSDLINYYYTYKKHNILFPQGFHVSLNDNQLEILMINSLKSVGFNKDNFEDFIQNKITWRSTNNISHITGYKYQFNTFYTYFDISDYKINEISFLKKNKLFLSESVALSKNAISRLVIKFSDHQLITEIKPTILIFDKRQDIINFNHSEEYVEIANNQSFTLLKLK
jgi:hypothetical protein